MRRSAPNLPIFQPKFANHYDPYDRLRYGMSRNLTFRSIFVRRNEAQREGCGTPIALRFKSNQVDGYRTSDFKEQKC